MQMLHISFGCRQRDPQIDIYEKTSVFESFFFEKLNDEGTVLI